MELARHSWLFLQNVQHPAHLVVVTRALLRVYVLFLLAVHIVFLLPAPTREQQVNRKARTETGARRPALVSPLCQRPFFGFFTLPGECGIT